MTTTRAMDRLTVAMHDPPMRDSSSVQTLERFVDALARRRVPVTNLPPGPRGIPFLGSFFDVHRDVLGMFERGLREHGDTVRFGFGPFDFVVVHRPEDIRTILLERADDFCKSPSYAGLELVIGKGLLTSEGEFWKRQRKLLTPAFHHKRLADFGATMVRCASELADGWDRASNTQVIDLHQQMLSLTLRIVGKTLFSTDLSAHAGNMGPALEVVLEHANFIATSMLMAPPQWMPTPRNRRFEAAMRVVDDLVLGIIAQRRRYPEKVGEDPGDLLGMLMAATGDDGAMTDRELRDEVATLVLAGHETTAQALTWTFMLLSRHPEIERRVVAEIQAVCGSAPPSFEQLRALEYTGRVIDESLRLYPPAWLYERQALVDVELGGYAIPAKTMVAVVPWTLHRHPSHWPNPEGFDPDRFLPEAVAARPRYTYLPFGGGPRQCIGVNFALYESKLVLATLLQRYSVELIPGQDLSCDAAVTLRPAHGMKVRLRRREAS
jgi:cytochrome P450